MLTLHEASKQVDGDLKRSAVIEMFAGSADLVAAMPLMDIPGNSYSYTQEAKLPSVGFRGYNDAYEPSVGVVNPQSETLRIAGGELDVDTALIKTHGIGIRTSQEQMQIKAFGQKIAAAFINGDGGDGVSFDGLRIRVRGYQLLDANMDNEDVSGALSLATLDEAIDRVDNPTHLIMSKRMRNLLSQAAKDKDVGGDLAFSKDDFGRRVAFYADLPILITEDDNEGKKIIDFNEVGPDGNANTQSLYVVSLGDGKIVGLQNGIMEVKDLGEIDAKPCYRTRVEWLVAMAVMHGKAVARVRGITDAKVTR
ncbi:capsid family protein [Sphingobium phage Lacusarx]|uniref:Capsid family protein n=1 Tax=Sphingobium phage Lacusarx TaxID=1980139 RepID=A0A1W6DWW0_9CAUD|nr:major head protein [Sphingobium phage Lacusarx]ARK07408.1 capsid family protein [Sphingobium phage Lacusarx]